MDIITASRFATLDLPDWRYILGTINAVYRLGSFSAAARFAEQVAAAADAAEHHPDIDIRYPDVVHIRLMTHASNGLTSLDTDLAATVSALAAQSGATAESAGTNACEVAIDALDIDAVRAFWRAAFDYVDAGDVIVDPARRSPAVWFQQMETPREERNNIHIDVSVTHDVAEERVAAVLAAGGRLVSDERAPAFWVLADPEGNEVCICTWQARD